MNQCPKDFDDERIVRKRKACGAPPINFRVGGDVRDVGRGHGGGGGGGRGGGLGRGGSRGGNYGQEDFSSPAKKETVSVVNGKAYAVCKDCGRNSGECAHTPGSHELSSTGGYLVTFDLKTKMNHSWVQPTEVVAVIVRVIVAVAMAA